VLVFLRRKVQINLRALEALHVFLDLGGIDVMWKQTDHERGVHDLAEAELLENLICYSHTLVAGT
jgi:prophage maintenance system killer protein